MLVGSVPEALWGRLFALFRTFIIAVTLHGDSVSVWFRFDAKTQKCLWDRTSAHHYTILFVVVGLLLPFVVTVISYWRIFVHIQRVKKRVLLSQFQARPPDIANKTRMQWRSEGVRAAPGGTCQGRQTGENCFFLNAREYSDCNFICVCVQWKQSFTAAVRTYPQYHWVFGCAPVRLCWYYANFVSGPIYTEY